MKFPILRDLQQTVGLVSVMVCDSETLERAYTYWRITGTRIDVEGIQSYQQSEGSQPCFGHAGDRCACHNCRWHDLCVALAQTPQVGETLWLTLQTDGNA
jgi:hypothetical protein